MNEGLERTRVALDCLGCKLNQAETELLAVQFAGAGYRLVSPEDGADIYILNTCTVTQVADRKSRHMLRLARRRNPEARLVAIGCYAERAPRELKQVDGDIDAYIPILRKNVEIAARAAEKLLEIPLSEYNELVYFLEGIKYYINTGNITSIELAGNKHKKRKKNK